MKKTIHTIGKIFKKSIITLSLILCLIAVAQPVIVHAEDTTCANNTQDSNDTGTAVSNPCVVPPTIPKPDTLPGPSTATDTGLNHERYLITDLIPTLIRGAINLLGGITIIAIMYAGIQYLTAFGDDTKLEAAKKNLIYAIIGLMIAMFSYTIVRIISDVPLSSTNEIPEATSDTTYQVP
ncbi:MAG: pilin [Candidatus Peregrinibacteria bacterium]|nr:pilin [Candidatus Peregrinibacteria bacterium]MDZ4244540.1 pilin [Candidatus Gracilibacteria bacterium]